MLRFHAGDGKPAARADPVIINHNTRQVTDKGFQEILQKEVIKAQRLIKKSQGEMIKSQHAEYITVHDLVRDYLSIKKLIVYGGYAINTLLPKKYRFYDEYDMPDFDCMSSRALSHIKEIQTILEMHGFPTLMKNGLHAGTYKLYYKNKAFLDITKINEKTHKRLLDLSEIDRKAFNITSSITLAPIMLLKSNFYKELSQPEESMYRWEKVYQRMLIFCYIFPLPKLKSPVCKTPLNQSSLGSVASGIESAYHYSLNVIREHRYPIIGHAALAILKGHNLYNDANYCKHISADPYIDVIATNDETAVTHFYKAMKRSPLIGDHIQITRKAYMNEVVPERINIHFNNGKRKIRIVRIFKMDPRCYSIIPPENVPQESRDYTVGSYDTILNVMYRMYIMYQIYEPEKVPGILKYIQEIENIVAGLYLKKDGVRLSVKCAHIV